MYNSYIENGVILVPNVIAEGDTATLRYKGLLKNSGADTVYMRVGYGDTWDDTNEIKMTKTSEGFEGKFPVTRYKKFNLAFKDSADHWDNNAGHNYSFEIQAR